MKKILAALLVIAVLITASGAVLLTTSVIKKSTKSTATSNNSDSSALNPDKVDKTSINNFPLPEKDFVEGDRSTVDIVNQMINDEPSESEKVGKVYYFDAINGSDDNDGLSKEKAFLSLNKANSLAIGAGDRLLFKRGGVWNGTLIPKSGGVEGSPVIIGMYGDDPQKPLFNGNGETFAVIELVNMGNIEVRNLEITNFSGTEKDYRIGVYVLAKEQGGFDNVKISNCYIHHVDSYMWRNSGHDYHWYGAIIVKDYNPTAGYTYENLIIENNRIEYSSATGIAVYTETNKTVIRNNIVNNLKGDGIILGRGVDGLIERNIAYTNGFSDIGEAWVNIWLYGTKGGVMQYNESYDCRASGDGQGFDIDNGCQDSLMQYNYSHDNIGGFLLFTCGGEFKNSTVRYNISQNDSGNLFTWALDANGKPIHVADIYNNTIYTTKQISKITYFYQYSFTHGKVGSFKNNIFYILGSSSATTWELAHMAYDFEGNSFYGDELDAPPDANGIFENPLLMAAGTGKIGMSTVDGYKLQVGSPLIGKGVKVENSGDEDYFGNKIDKEKPNIGAYGGKGENLSETANIAAGKVSSASGYGVVSFGNKVDYSNRLTDQNLSTSFNTGKKETLEETFIILNLSSEYEVGGVVMTAASNPQYFPNSYKVQVPDGEGWKTVAEFKGKVSGGERAVSAFDTVKTDKIRIVSSDLNQIDGSYSMEFAEMEAYKKIPENN